MNILGYLQKLGKALMLPIATLPVAALLLRLGQPDLLDIPFMSAAGGAIFDHLPLLFGLGIAAGLAKDDSAAAALAGAVGYFVLTGAAQTIDASINMSFFGGIIAGIIAGHSYNRFHAVKLPDYLAFFGGKRLVPIMTGLISLAAAFVAGFVWPLIQSGIDAFGHAVATSGAWGQFSYGLLNRGLIPVGLHHVMNSIFWFGLGDCVRVTYELVGSGVHNICVDPATVEGLIVGATVPGIDGSSVQAIASEVTRGDLHRFFAGDPTAGVFMAGFYPIMMFGLPAGALAMYLAAPKGNRAQVGGILLSVALTAFLTGVTEPLEFLFVFLAPALYVVHAVLTGLSLVITNALGVLHGFGFSAGLFDMVLNWGLATHPVTLLFIGLAFAATYFCVFYFAIKFFDLKTPGREDNGVEAEAVDGAAAPVAAKVAASSDRDVALQYLKALGGHDNLTGIDACITRLRLTMKDRSVADERVLKALGANGVVKLGQNNLQVILGPKAELIAAAMKQISPTEDLSAVVLP